MLIDEVEGRRRWRRKWRFNFRANCARSGNAGNSETYSNCPKFLQAIFRMQNLRFAQSLCDAQGLSEMTLN
jgi:hypothetical protein